MTVPSSGSISSVSGFPVSQKGSGIAHDVVKRRTRKDFDSTCSLTYK